jgi:hypothetical protein
MRFRLQGSFGRSCGRRQVIWKLCLLVVPVATVAPHWSKLVRSSLLSGREAPDGYLRIRTAG